MTAPTCKMYRLSSRQPQRGTVQPTSISSLTTFYSSQNVASPRQICRRGQSILTSSTASLGNVMHTCIML